MNRKSNAAAAARTAAVPPAVPPVPHACSACEPFASIPGNVRRDGHVYVNRATVPECNADVAANRAANDTARAARAAVANGTDAERAAANVAVKRTGDRVWRTRNPHGLGGTVTAARAARTAAVPPVTNPALSSIIAAFDSLVPTVTATADRLTAAGVPTNPADIAAAVNAAVAAYVANINVAAVYAATLTARRAAIDAAINAATA